MKEFTKEEIYNAVIAAYEENKELFVNFYETWLEDTDCTRKKADVLDTRMQMAISMALASVTTSTIITAEALRKLLYEED